MEEVRITTEKLEHLWYTVQPTKRGLHYISNIFNYVKILIVKTIIYRVYMKPVSQGTIVAFIIIQ